MEKTQKQGKQKQKVWWIVGVCAVLLAALAAVFFWMVLPGLPFHTNGSGQYVPMNALPETLDSMAALKDGDLYLIRGDTAERIAQKLYDPETADDYQNVSYIWDQNTNEMIFLADAAGERELIYFDGSETHFIARGVDSWNANLKSRSVAFVIGTSAGTGAGKLMFCRLGQAADLLSENVIATSVVFSEDGKKLYASLNSGDHATLMCFEGRAGREVWQGTGGLLWLSGNGENFLYAEIESSGQYACTAVNAAGKTREFREVCQIANAADSSVLYLLADYQAESERGTLYALNPDTLQTKKLADGVSYMNATAVNDLSRGIVYAAATSTENRYNIAYAALDGTRLDLLEKAHIRSLSCVYVNSAAKKGCMILQGNSAEGNRLYAFSWAGGRLKAQELDDGSIYEVIYYEKCDTALYTKDGSGSSAALYRVDAEGSITKEIDRAGAIYDSNYGLYYSCSVLSNTGEYILYFKDLVTLTDAAGDEFASHPMAEMYGTLMRYNTKTQEYQLIAKNVKADTFTDIKSDGAGSSVYFSMLNEKNFDICYFNGRETVPVLQGADALLDTIIG